MDKYDQTMQGLMKSTPADFSKAVTALKGMCVCPGCPTHTDCAKGAKEVLFCALGESFHCISIDKGCICPTCPVTSQLGLTRDRYCMKGDEAHQRYFLNLR